MSIASPKILGVDTVESQKKHMKKYAIKPLFSVLRFIVGTLIFIGCVQLYLREQDIGWLALGVATFALMVR